MLMHLKIFISVYQFFGREFLIPESAGTSGHVEDK